MAEPKATAVGSRPACWTPSISSTAQAQRWPLSQARMAAL
eukprot:CAMPEP_0179145940 /NCGR_PEP_ID=MMETSP0796-20121207/70446_1 /TAXON_ID=73915 /ORGANISM="Pyrodinium bahamense, Strain pbaha01" /LENGTH=39 /DNA_ID= /DNA_START= /DNA_END= /DNA_ORIENTATION=